MESLSQPSGPVRTCVGCRQRATARELLRIVVADGVIVPDPSHRAAGRGAHLHPTADCLASAVRRRAFGRALRVEGGLDHSAVTAYVEALASVRSTDLKEEHPLMNQR